MDVHTDISTFGLRVMSFHSAPKEIRELSDNGGDEDWVIFIPADCIETWHEEQDVYQFNGFQQFGDPYWVVDWKPEHEDEVDRLIHALVICDAQIVRMPDDSAIVITCHA